MPSSSADSGYSSSVYLQTTPFLPEELLDTWQTSLMQKAPIPGAVGVPRMGVRPVLGDVSKYATINLSDGMRSDHRPPLLKVKLSSDAILIARAMLLGASARSGHMGRRTPTGP